MQHQRIILFCIALIAFGFLGAQQANDVLLDFNQARIDHQRKAMLTLGGWAVVNIATGLSLRGSAEGSTRHFHEMNALWNVVNLGIAGFGYYAAVRENPGALDAFASMQEHYKFEKILLFNAGLDVGYMMAGLYLTERARRPGVRADQLKGFGQSIMVQGGFLFVFDLVNYFISSGRTGDLKLMLGRTGEGIGMTLTF
jgi:hypothetical protein